VNRFVEATNSLGPSEVERLVGISPQTLARYKEGNFKRLFASTRRKMVAFLEGAPPRVGPDKDPVAIQPSAPDSVSEAAMLIRRGLEILEGATPAKQPASTEFVAAKFLTGHALYLEGTRDAEFKRLDAIGDPNAHQKAWAFSDEEARALIGSGEISQSDLHAWRLYRLGAINSGVYRPEEELDDELRRAAESR
jgi:hypothetical protein